MITQRPGVRINPPEIDARVAAFMYGAHDEDVAWWLAMANMVTAEPIGQALYLAHMADETARFPAIKAWAYRAAVEFAGSRGSKQRKRSQVENYRTSWAHQAARDGAAIALWGREGVPGIGVRCRALGCGSQAYGRVRDAVQNQTTDLIGDYRVSLRWAKGEIHSSDHIDRWELATGRRWSDALK